MKIVITGATGNVGTSVIESLAEDPAVTEIVGLARRKPDLSFDKTRLVSADVTRDDLERHFAGADAVVHLAWLIQPERNPKLLEAVNVQGSRRVFEAAIAAGVPAIVHASSFGVYAAGPKDRPVGEGWSTAGIPTSLYSCQKSIVERHLDEIEREHPSLRVVRLRTGLVLKRPAASELHRNFLGRFVPMWLFRKRLIAVVPDIPQLRVQALHGTDVGRAYRQAILSDVRGPFNIAADPVLDADVVARLFGARKVRMKARTLRRLVVASYRLHLQQTSPGLIDMALQLPIMDITRAHEELGWHPQTSATEALMEVFEGMKEKAGMRTPPLQPARQSS
jgi:UDP-glucose 4-epimerase